MRTSGQWTTFAVMTILGLLWIGPARGQDAPPPSDNEAVEPDDATTEAPEGADSKAPEGEKQPAEVDRRRQELEYLTELRQAVTKEIRLSDDQTRTIMELFKAHTEFVENYRPEEAEEAVDPKAAEAEREEIRAQLREARRNRDRDRVMQLMEKLRESQPTDEIMRATRQFHQAVAQELDPDQQQQFREIVRRLYRQPEDPMERARNRARGFRTMRRVLGELNLSDEQNQQVRELFSENLRAFGRNTDDAEQAAKIQEELRAKILDILDDEQ